jgi:2-methylcitrate dehydratase PrpD
MPDDRLHIVSNRDIPDICLQHLLAITLADGALTFASSHDEDRMRDPAVLTLREKITVIPSQELTRTFAVRGTPDNPMTPAEVEAKATELIAPVIGAARAAELVQAVMTLDDVADVASLNPLLRAG